MLYIWQNFRLSDWDIFEQSPRAVKPFFITSMKNITQKNVIVKSGPSRSLQITFRPHSIKQHSKSVAVLITFFFLIFNHSSAFPWASSKWASFSPAFHLQRKEQKAACNLSVFAAVLSLSVVDAILLRVPTKQPCSLLPRALNVPSRVPARHKVLFTFSFPSCSSAALLSDLIET